MPLSGSEHIRISFLFNKYVNGTCSQKEADEIVSILEDSENDISLLNELGYHWDNLNSSPKEASGHIDNQFIMDQILDKLHHRIRLDEEKNGRKTSEMTLKKIMELMKSDEGKTINMVIVRKNQELRLSFTLEDPIPYQE